MNRDPYEIAMQMLNADELGPDGTLPQRLFHMITEVDDMCSRVHGELVSRQAIAILIMVWRNGGN